MGRPALATRLFWGGLAGSLACGLAAQVLLAARPLAFTAHWFRQPVLLAALHLTTLGFVGLIIFGVLSQFLPMLLGTGLGSAAWTGVGLGLLAVGLGLLLGVFLGWDTRLSVSLAGASLLCAAALLLGLAWSTLTRRGTRHPLARATVVSSLAYLTATAALGAAFAQGWAGPPWLKGDPLALIRLHAHLGLVGFGSLMVFGVSYALLPMFHLSNGWPAWPGWSALAAAHLGLALTALEASGLAPWAGPLAEALLGLGAAFYLVQVAFIRSHAARRQSDASWLCFLGACACLAAAAAWACVLALRPHGPRQDSAAAYLLLFGFLGGAIASQLLKIVPLLSWVDRFSSLVGKAATPKAGDLLDGRLAWAVPVLHPTAVLSGGLGLALGDPSLLRLSGCLGAALLLDLGLVVVAARLRRGAEPGSEAGAGPTTASPGAAPATT